MIDPRPITLDSINRLCKVLESKVRDSILEYVEKHELIRESHHGFVENKSCSTDLLEFLEFVTNCVDQGYPIDVIYLDFHKAFDEVPQKRIIIKINALGITYEVVEWIEDWLKDREQRVVLMRSNSK